MFNSPVISCSRELWIFHKIPHSLELFDFTNNPNYYLKNAKPLWSAKSPEGGQNLFCLTNPLHAGTLSTAYNKDIKTSIEVFKLADITVVLIKNKVVPFCLLKKSLMKDHRKFVWFLKQQGSCNSPLNPIRISSATGSGFQLQVVWHICRLQRTGNEHSVSAVLNPPFWKFWAEHRHSPKAKQYR